MHRRTPLPRRPAFADEVRVKREIGGTQGYDDRAQAIAVARMAGADPAAVFLAQDGKWHAVEITADISDGPFQAAAGADQLHACHRPRR